MASCSDVAARTAAQKKSPERGVASDSTRPTSRPYTHTHFQSDCVSERALRGGRAGSFGGSVSALCCAWRDAVYWRCAVRGGVLCVAGCCVWRGA
eukprot:329841-Chlamydomonas_euryale.AAC.1